MEARELKNNINEMIKELDAIKSRICFTELENKYVNLSEKINKSDFWQSKDFNETMKEYTQIKEIVCEIKDLSSSLENLNELIDILNEKELEEIEIETEKLKKQIDILKTKSMLSGEFDYNNVYIEIHSGAGGTESNDWANMIARMYMRYFENKGWKYQVESVREGEEVGIKGILISVENPYAFGYLKGETGVHRLVRISPFDSNKRRHTSFASVLVTPQIDNNIEIEIKEEDLKIDVYHSGGAGGQSVNTTDSAVRMTHLPTGIVVTCQNERSQLKNKEKALEILKSRIYILEKSKVDEKLKDLKGETMDVNFGSAIRSYVMCPYSLVKDTRTNAETSNVEKV